MNLFNRFFSLKVLSVFCVGILCYQWQILKIESFHIPVFFLILGFLFSLPKQFLKFSFKKSSVYFFLGFIFTLANYLSNENDPENKCAFLNRFYSLTNEQVILAETGDEEFTNSAILKIKAFLVSDSLQISSGKFLVRNKNFEKLGLRKNSTFLVRGIFKPIKNKKLLPGEFDFRSYLKRKSVISQLDATAVIFMKENSGSFFAELRNSVYERLDEMFSKSSIPVQVKIICRALLIGDDSGLDDNLFSSYSSTGTLHVLAVSGMHVGILFSIFQFVFRFFQNGKQIRIIKFVSVVFFIWIYAFITGFSPSIIRAVIMLSVFMFGELIKRKSRGLNSLFLSAFVMLLYSPDYLFDLGFQLSIGAVAGILLFYSFFKKFFNSDLKWLSLIGDMVAVTLAAQMLTWPISLFYFHQFPLLFLPANLFIVPLSTICLFSCLIWLLVFPIPVLALFFSTISIEMVTFMNSTAKFIAKLPFNAIESLRFSFSDLLISYLLILVFCFAIQNKKRIILFFSLLLVLLMQSFHLFDQIVHLKTIYAFAITNGKSHVLIIVSNRKAILLHASPVKLGQKKIFNFLTYSGYHKSKEISLFEGYHFISFAGKNLLLVNSSLINSFDLDKEFDAKWTFENKHVLFSNEKNRTFIEDNLFISNEF